MNSKRHQDTEEETPYHSEKLPSIVGDVLVSIFDNSVKVSMGSAWIRFDHRLNTIGSTRPFNAFFEMTAMFAADEVLRSQYG